MEFEFNGETRTPSDRLLIGATTTLDGHELRIVNPHLLAFFMLNASSEVHIGQRELVVEELRAARRMVKDAASALGIGDAELARVPIGAGSPLV